MIYRTVVMKWSLFTHTSSGDRRHGFTVQSFFMKMSCSFCWNFFIPHRWFLFRCCVYGDPALSLIPHSILFSVLLSQVLLIDFPLRQRLFMKFVLMLRCSLLRAESCLKGNVEQSHVSALNQWLLCFKHKQMFTCATHTASGNSVNDANGDIPGIAMRTTFQMTILIENSNCATFFVIFHSVGRYASFSDRHIVSMWDRDERYYCEGAGRKFTYLINLIYQLIYLLVYIFYLIICFNLHYLRKWCTCHARNLNRCP